MEQILTGLQEEIGDYTRRVDEYKELLLSVAKDLDEAQKTLDSLTSAHSILTGKNPRPVLVESDPERAHRTEAPRRLQAVPEPPPVPPPPPVDQGPPCPSCGATKLFRTNRKLSNGRTVSMVACGECSTELLG